MSKYLCTFSGKFGDILWSLPTAKFIAEKIVSGPVDFAVMPYYESLLPLLEAQSYISRAFVIPDWIRTHSNHGDGPAEPPKDCWLNKPDMSMGRNIDMYEKFWHLAYKGHPGITAPSMSLVDFVAWQQGITLENPIPFLEASSSSEAIASTIHFDSGQLPEVAREGRLVTYSFNEQYAEPKKEFFEALWQTTRSNPSVQDNGPLEFLNLTDVKWLDALWLLQKSVAFVGCRSANHVLAVGMGKQTITFEPHPSRHANCHLGKVFGCPYGRETPLPFAMPPRVAAEVAASMLRKMMEEQCRTTISVTA